MSSASAVAPASNNVTAAAASSSHTTATPSNAALRTNARSSSQVKNSDSARRQSPSDIAARRGPAHKAWASGTTNPLTQRGPAAAAAAPPPFTHPTPQSNQSNGVAAAARSSSSSSKMPAAKDTGLSERHAHDRSIAAFGAAMGSITTVSTKTGDRYRGYMAGAALVPAASARITLKMTKKLPSWSAGATANGLGSREAALVGASPEYAMSWDVRELVEIDFDDLSLVETAKLANGSSSKFRTDVDISGNLQRGERQLQPWVPDAPDDTDYSLASGTTGDWDQFATAKQMTGIESTYNENEYTTALDKNSLSYKLKEAEAERVEREILSSTSTNVHIREERGQQADQAGDDEEAKYSGVRRNAAPQQQQQQQQLATGASNKYTPPAKRAPTAQPTVPGAPVDPAILSTTKPTPAVAKNDKSETESAKAGAAAAPAAAVTVAAPAPASGKQSPSVETASQKRAQNTSVSPQRPAPIGGQTEGVEGRLLHSFREFKDTEKQKLLDRKRQQANHDRTAKLNELLRFSRTFKLNAPLPTDLVGILAKDPVKQEAIIEKAKKEREESASPAKASPAGPAAESAASTTKKTSEFPTQPTAATPDRQQVGNKGRGALAPPSSARAPSSTSSNNNNNNSSNSNNNSNSNSNNNSNNHQPHQQASATPLAGRGGGLQRAAAGVKPLQVHQIPAPIPILDGRTAPPAGPTADAAGAGAGAAGAGAAAAASATSPRRSSVNTPTSAASAKFNLSVKAAEFRPSAPSFNPSTSSNAPSSPASVQRTTPLSRTGSPSSFFGSSHKPKPLSERASIADKFNPIAKMKAEVAARVAGSESSKAESGGQAPPKDYAANGGIPYAYQTIPRWTVRQENDEKTYKSAFERPAPPTPQPGRASATTPHIAYPGLVTHLPPGQGHLVHGAASAQPIHANGLPPHYGQYDDGHGHGRPFIPVAPAYATTNAPSRQTSAYASPSVPGAQLVYGGSQPYYAVNSGGQMPMRYPSTPMHQAGQIAATPMMVPQQPNGFIPAPQPYNAQMTMYSPNPAHVYPQANGYGSPGRAPMMMQQGSQQSHHHGQPMMYTLSQGGPMAYAQPAPGPAPMGRGYGGQYGTSPQQSYGMQPRAMSSGYGQKVMQQQQQQQQPPPPPQQQQQHGQPAPINAPHQPAAYAQETGQEGK